MEIRTSENLSHVQIGSNSQNYGGSAGSSSIHNGNNFGQMNANDSSSNVNGMMDKNYRSDAALSDNK